MRRHLCSSPASGFLFREGPVQSLGPFPRRIQGCWFLWGFPWATWVGFLCYVGASRSPEWQSRFSVDGFFLPLLGTYHILELFSVIFRPPWPHTCVFRPFL